MLPNNWLSANLRDLASLAPIQEIDLPELADKQVSLSIKRDDVLHPLLGGNKLYKLFGYLRDYLKIGQGRPIATFGGAYSNHIIAAAAAANMIDIPVIGVIRGERPARLSATLTEAQALGMRLLFVSRSDYRHRGESQYRLSLEERLGPCFWIPEGGAGTSGARGLATLASTICERVTPRPDAVFHACGTGSSTAGLAAGFAESACNIPVYGVAVLKWGKAMSDAIDEQIRALTSKTPQWYLLDQYHGGGYAKLSKEMTLFMHSFEQRTGIPLDPVYTVKMIWAILALVREDFFAPGTRILAIHSGGIQGRRGLAGES